METEVHIYWILRAPWNDSSLLMTKHHLLFPCLLWMCIASKSSIHWTTSESQIHRCWAHECGKCAYDLAIVWQLVQKQIYSIIFYRHLGGKWWRNTSTRLTFSIQKLHRTLDKQQAISHQHHIDACCSRPLHMKNQHKQKLPMNCLICYTFIRFRCCWLSIGGFTLLWTIAIGFFLVTIWYSGLALLEHETLSDMIICGEALYLLDASVWFVLLMHKYNYKFCWTGEQWASKIYILQLDASTIKKMQRWIGINGWDISINGSLGRALTFSNSDHGTPKIILPSTLQYI